MSFSTIQALIVILFIGVCAATQVPVYPNERKIKQLSVRGETALVVEQGAAGSGGDIVLQISLQCTYVLKSLPDAFSTVVAATTDGWFWRLIPDGRIFRYNMRTTVWDNVGGVLTHHQRCKQG